MRRPAVLGDLQHGLVTGLDHEGSKFSRKVEFTAGLTINILRRCISEAQGTRQITSPLLTVPP
jgi:hypothetical protein